MRECGRLVARWRAALKLWRGVHVMVGNTNAASELMAELPELAALGINAVVLEIDYSFAFESHPELRNTSVLTKEQATRLGRACRERGIRPIPLFNCLGHQSWSKRTGPLLTKYPELDETPGQFPENKGIYRRSWCPHPKVNEIVFVLLDELIAAFEADAVHVGMDEVFLIASPHCARCKDGDPAKLFANARTICIAICLASATSRWRCGLIVCRRRGDGLWRMEAAKNGTHAPSISFPKISFCATGITRTWRSIRANRLITFRSRFFWRRDFASGPEAGRTCPRPKRC
jgi:hypothetical protein